MKAHGRSMPTYDSEGASKIKSFLPLNTTDYDFETSWIRLLDERQLKIIVGERR